MGALKFCHVQRPFFIQLGIKHYNFSALGNFNMISQLRKEGVFAKPGSSPILAKRVLGIFVFSLFTFLKVDERWM
jgi:hypothetical protein